MRCNSCGYTRPYDPKTAKDPHCPSCTPGILEITTEDWLSEPSMGLVKEIRPGQISLGNVIDEAVRGDTQQIVIAQGGCGLGKSFSYLVPALQRKKRIIISTAKKSLQGQLANKDLPYLQDHLGLPTHFVSIKGRNNYLCKLFLQKKKEKFTKRGESGLYKQLTTFLAEHPSGDLDAFPGGVSYPTTLCTATECIGKACSHATDCGYRKLKSNSKVAMAVVVNHSYLGFDLRFGPQKLFGEYDILIIDEAHAAEDFFRNAFTDEISAQWMGRTLKDMHDQNIAMRTLPEKDIMKTWDKLFSNVPEQPILPVGFFGDIAPVTQTLHTLRQTVDTHVATYWPIFAKIDIADLFKVQQVLENKEVEDRNDMLICARLADKLDTMLTTIQSTATVDENLIRIREESRRPNGDFKVIMKPIDIGRRVGSKLSMINKIIMTSATLDAGLLERDLGIRATKTINEPSPFNYKANGLVYIPKTVPNPSNLYGDKTDWIEQIGREIQQLVTASNGNALVLFTSIKEMEEVLEYIDANFNLQQPIFAQESGRRPDEVFKDFMETDNAILFGSKSFFEGIDVQGDKLRLVILTKLPFPIWGDPIVQAKKQQLGSQHFAQYYLPKMFIDLMQAAGRLIRTQMDRGVFAILDVRMWVGSNKRVDPEKIKIVNGSWPGYGNKAFQQLPFSNVTPNFSMAKRFLEHIQR